MTPSDMKTPRFKSRSPAPLGGYGAEKRGWENVTRHQISGVRFWVRRIINGIVRHDTTMVAEPLRRQIRSFTVGGMIGALLLLAAFVLGMFKAGGVPGANDILADRTTSALYVRINDDQQRQILHPVLNLASARLIVNKAANPVPVKSGEIDKFPRGNTVGIPGAPQRIVPSTALDSRWLVCDALSGPDRGVTVIAGDPSATPGQASPIPASTAVLATADAGESTWLIWEGKRSRIDLGDTVVRTALGINIDSAPPRPINRQLLNLIPESPPLVVPFIANPGDPPRFVWPAPGQAPVIGSVVVDHENERTNYFAVTADGLQPIPATIATMLRARDAYGLIKPPELTPDQIAKAPVARPIPVEDYPAAAVKVADPSSQPVTCGQWVKLASSPTSTLVLLLGESLPIAPQTRPVPLVPAGPITAARVVMPSGTGFFVQITGQQPRSETRESVYWVSDLGVRYGIESGLGSDNPAAALGMTTEKPLPMPWSILLLLSAGPTLSKADALVAH